MTGTPEEDRANLADAPQMQAALSESFDDEQELLTAWEEYRQALTPQQRAAEDAALDAADRDDVGGDW